MLAPDGSFHYVINGFEYYLLPAWTGSGHRTRVRQAQMWSPDGEFKGTWVRTQMPLRIIWQLEHHCRWLEALGFTSNGDETLGPGEMTE